MSLPRCALSLSFCILLLLLPLGSSAQLPNATDTTATPAPGMHDYLGSPVETVNPANGAVSIRIPVRMAQGRQLTVPFSFAYDSNGAFYIGELSIGSGPRYITTPNPTSPAIIGTRGGWSYSYPVMSLNGGTWTIPGSLDHIITCYGSENYVFQDPNGNRHNLGLSVSANVASPDGYDNCNQGLQGDGEHTTGQEGPIAASTTIPGLNNGIYPAVSVADGDGTVYSFNGGSPGTTGLTNLATSVTDRNGNTATLTYSNLAVTYKDMLGRTALSTSGMGGSPDTITAGGLSNSYKAYWTTASASFPLDMLNLEPGVLPACPTSMSGSSNVISSIVLPNGQQFTLTYDPTYGMLTKIVYPSGGYIRYVWGLNSQAEAGAWRYSANGTVYAWACRYDFPAVTDRYVSYNGTTEVLHQHFAYSTNWTNNTTSSWNYKTTTVTTTDLVRNTSFTTGYTYSPLGIASVPNCYSCYITQQVPVEHSIQYNDIGGKQLETVTKNWASVRIMTSAETTLNDISQSSLTAYCYDANEQLLEKDEYDFGTSTPTPAPCATLPSGAASGALKRKTITSYATFPPAHIVDRPSTVVTYDGSGDRVAETDYPSYDANGNLLKQTKQCFALPGGSACPQGNSTTTFTYDSNGQTLTMVDPLNNTTSFSYTDNYSGCGGSAPPTSPSDAYLTQVTYPATNGVSHIIKYCYDYIKGLQLSSTDENNQTTSYAYVDSLDRLTQASYPDGGLTTVAYNDSPFNPSTPSPSVTTTKAMTSSTNLVTVAASDGLGHVVETLLTSDPDCASGDLTKTAYDGQGHVYTVTNPYCTTSDPTYGITTYVYDALGRTTQVTNPDNSTILTTYTGRATQVQDEGNGTQRVTRVSQTDALGRLNSICEVSSSTLLGQSGSPATCPQDIADNGFFTSYQYDVLGNLLGITQGVMAARTFTYDSLSRLTSASNPESGSVSYSYDANSNLSSKTGPLQNQTGTPTVTTSYAYDALNRMLTKSYNDGATPTATFVYDSTSWGTLTNAIGRLVESTTTAHLGYMATYTEYDPMGRVSKQFQYTPMGGQNEYPMPYTYDLMGNMTAFSDGYFVSWYPAYNGAGRLLSLTAGTYELPSPYNLLSGAHYNAAGQITSDSLATGETETFAYTKRLQLQSDTATVSPTTVYSYGLTFAPNGDVTAANDNVNGNWNYQYDQFNRLICSNLASNGTCASPTNGTQTYSYAYDRFGNRWQQNGPYTFTASFTGNNTANNNRMDTYSYDSAGNLLYDGTHYYFYDAENHLIQVDGTLGYCTAGAGTAATACYVYDAEGHRVHRTGVVTDTCDATGKRDYAFDLAGNWVGEYNSSGTGCMSEIYAGGRHLVTYAGGTPLFIHSDWLGTVRRRNSATYPTYNFESCTSLPFGDGLSCSGGDQSTLHFTGKEHDFESGLDNFLARFNASNFGRFTSVDPDNDSGRENHNDPQAWNAYSYVRNNPVNLTDPDGRSYDVCVDNGNGGQNCVHYANDADFETAAAKSGATLQNGQILVNGQQIGTYTHILDAGVENGGSSEDTILAPAVLGAFIGGIQAGIRGLAEGLFGGGARSAGEEAVATTISSTLKDASEAAFKAAQEDFQVPLKHLPGAGGNWAKFASDVDPKAVVREALTSPNAKFLPNGTDPNSFRVVTDLGKVVGSKGETAVRVVVDFSGKIWTALPVKSR